MIEKGINAPLTSSMGRLFDGIAAILGIRETVSYHAQAAILLEQAALKSETTQVYEFEVLNSEVDWRPVVSGVVEDLKSGKSLPDIARKFHNTVIEVGMKVALKLRDETGINTVALSGGVFQNKILTENLSTKLEEKGVRVLIHQLVPPNDGGISLGQAVYGGLIEESN